MGRENMQTIDYNIFEEIKNFPNYEINRLGIIRNKQTKKNVKSFPHKNGYYYVNLYQNKKHKHVLVSRLMAIQYLNLDTQSLLVVNHKDFNKANNCITNLEIVTQKENIQHSIIGGKQRHKKGKEHLHSKKVWQYTMNYQLVKIWDCVMDIERTLNIKSNYISNCALGKCKQTHGFIWKYKPVTKAEICKNMKNRIL